MDLNELRKLAKALNIDLEEHSNLIYVFYTTPDGLVNSLTISARRAKLPNGRRMGDADLAALMQEYPAAREGTVVAVERPRGDLHRWMDAHDVMELLHTSNTSLKRWAQQGLLHPTYLGRKKYYDADEVDRLLRSNAVQENGRLDRTALDEPYAAPEGNGPQRPM